MPPLIKCASFRGIHSQQVTSEGNIEINFYLYYIYILANLISHGINSPATAGSAECVQPSVSHVAEHHIDKLL